MDRNKSNEVIGTHIVLMSKMGKMDSSLQSLWLPEPPEGKFRFSSESADNGTPDVYFEAIQGKWFACSPIKNHFVNWLGEACSSVEISDKCIFMIKNAGQMDVVYAETVYKTSGVFHNYFVDDAAEIMIGRSGLNDVVYPNALVSGTHAVLKRNNDLWWVKDLDSANGVYVNGKKVLREELHLGDVVYIMGLRIIIGVGFVSINDGNARVIVNPEKLYRVRPSEGHSMSGIIPEDGNENEWFNRLPRKRKPLNAEPIAIEAPPVSLSSNNIPLLLRMGSPLVVSSMSLMAGNITSMLSSVLFPVLTQKYTEKQKKDYEDRRNLKYNEYLQNKRKEILAEKESEMQALQYNYPDIDRVLSFTKTKERLWERRMVDDDFMSLRIGNGDYPLLAPYETLARGFEIDEDPLMEKMYQLAEMPVLLEKAPVMASFLEDTVCGVVGERPIVFEFVQRLIIQLAILHSYDEVKMIFLVEENELSHIEFIKYLPHIWNDQRDFRFLATNTSSGYQIGEYLKQVVEVDLDKQRNLKDILKERPYYIMFALSKRIFDSMEVLKDIMQTEQNCGVSVVAVFDDLPKECSKIFDLKASKKHSMVSLKQIDKENEYFRLDHVDQVQYLQSMKEVANTRLKMITQAYALPKVVTFLEMFGVGRVEHLNPIKRWKDNNPVRSLAAPVGVATDGSLFMLDLHEKYQGPHGLVAGMTGSGKSEFLISYILSMAINYHPDEVSFVLIDYKGGGLADAFDNPEKGIHLPHLVGTITNLDGSSIQRSLRSLHSEVMRRQQIFKKAKAITEEATMDIYKYQKLYRNGQIDEPMSHLFIISDEFAELKQQEPEFMDNLISIARIGRSLGVHLILATQKPSGVVNDQIRSNTKFRVCLKVQEKADSQDMLKRSEAAELKDTGRFYLQVGYNEFFALGQSAWSGADYVPTDEVVVQRDDSIEFIDTVGQNIYVAKFKSERPAAEKSQLKAVVELLSDAAEQVKIRTKHLWKPALPKKISVESVARTLDWKQSAPSEVLIGLVDDPDNQTQFPLVYDVRKDPSLLIVGEQGCGKTTVIQNILLSLVNNCSAAEFNMYILDFSSRMLKLFNRMPHCGAVLFEEETESLDHFFGLVNGIVEERKRLFTQLEVDSYHAANMITPIPVILVVIDGFTGLKSSKPGEMHAYNLKDYIKNGLNYGIKYVISCNHSSDIPSKIKQELGCVYALQLKDKFEYSEVLKHSVTYVPTALPGRGMVCIDEHCLEFQAASISESIGSKEYVKEIKNQIEALARHRSSTIPAKHLPVLSPTATYEEFAGQFGRRRIPIGYDLRSKKPVAMPLKQFSILSVYFGNRKGQVPIFENLLFAARREMMDVRIVRRSAQSCFDLRKADHVAPEYLENVQLTESDPLSLKMLWKQLVDEVSARTGILSKYCQDHHLDIKQKDITKYTYAYMAEKTTPLLVLIENLVDFSGQLDNASALVYDQLFRLCYKFNIYFVAGIEPNDDERDEDVLIMSGFTSNGCILFSGGQLDKQKFHMFDDSEIQGGKELPYNLCWMRYRDNTYPVLMPCGKLEEKILDEDDESIF